MFSGVMLPDAKTSWTALTTTLTSSLLIVTLTRQPK